MTIAKRSSQENGHKVGTVTGSEKLIPLREASRPDLSTRTP